jgi:hypothetical protein
MSLKISSQSVAGPVNFVFICLTPWAAGNEYRIRFTNNEATHRFRVKVEGISYTGKIIHYETILE